MELAELRAENDRLIEKIKRQTTEIVATIKETNEALRGSVSNHNNEDDNNTVLNTKTAQEG